MGQTSDREEFLESLSPLGYAGGQTNLTAYVGNSPTNATDPSGETAVTLAPTVVSPGSVVPPMPLNPMTTLTGMPIGVIGPSNAPPGWTPVPPGSVVPPMPLNPMTTLTGMPTGVIDGSIDPALINPAMPLSSYVAFEAQAQMVRDQYAMLAQNRSQSTGVGLVNGSASGGTPVSSESNTADGSWVRGPDGHWRPPYYKPVPKTAFESICSRLRVAADKTNISEIRENCDLWEQSFEANLRGNGSVSGLICDPNVHSAAVTTFSVWWFGGHAAYLVELNDGTRIYVDNGFLSGDSNEHLYILGPDQAWSMLGVWPGEPIQIPGWY